MKKIKEYFSAPFGKSDYVIALILALLTFALCAIKIVNREHTWGDDSAYISQAIALANGAVAQYIADNTLMMSKCDWLYGPYAYPWGFPALLAIAYKIFGFNVFALKSVGMICYSVFVGIFYIFCVNRIPRIYALFATLFFAINSYMTNFAANGIVSDIPFMLFGFIALIILAKLFCESHHNDKKGVDCFGNSCESPRNDDSTTSSLRGSVSKANTTKQSMNQKMDCHENTAYFLAMTGRVDSSLRSIANTEAIYYSHNDDSMHSTSSLRGKAEAIQYSRNSGILIAIFGGIFMLFATMIRIHGFVILCALITMHGILLTKRFVPKIFTMRILKPFSLIDSPYSWKIHTIPYVIFAIGFVIVSITLSSGGSGHWSILANASIDSILHNLYSYSVRFNQFFDLSEKDFAILAVCLAPFLLLGLRECLKSTESSATIFYVIFACGFFALLLLWVETFGSRFVFLLLPFLVFWTTMGLLKAKKIYGYAMSAVLLVILGSFVHLNVLDLDFKDKMGRTSDMAVGKYSEETLQIWDFIKNNTPQDSIIISFKPRTLYLNTNRLSFATAKIERLDEADFVLWWADFAKLNIDSKAFQSKTQLIFQNAEYKLFKVIK